MYCMICIVQDSSILYRVTYTIKNLYIHTVATGLLGSRARCSATFFMMVGMVEGVELTVGITVEWTGEEGAMVVGSMVVLVVMATIFSTTFSTASFTILLNPAVMLTHYVRVD